MRFPRVAVIAVSALALLAGVLLGLFPIQASMTQISPELRRLSVSCGNGYLGTTPATYPGDVVELPGEPGVFLPRASYDTHCDEAVGWRRYAAWGLTALGALGLAVTVAGARTPAPAGSPRRGRGGAHRARSKASARPAPSESSGEKADEKAVAGTSDSTDSGGSTAAKAGKPARRRA
jgi:hypothetical protein